MTSARWSDAWILLAVAWANRGGKCDLASVLKSAASPWLDRGPPTVEELRAAGRRLLPARLLRVSGDCYELTPKGKSLCDEASSTLLAEPREGGAFHRDINWLAERLEGLPEDEGSPWDLDPRAYQDALELNRGKARAWPAAWIFAAVAWANHWGRCDLPGVLFAADAINHAKPRIEEVEGAVRHLVPAGLLDVSGDCFRLTPQGKSLWEEASSGSEYVFDTLDRLQVRFGSVSPQDHGYRWTLGPAVYEEAWDRYSEEFQRIYEESKSKKRREQEP